VAGITGQIVDTEQCGLSFASLQETRGHASSSCGVTVIFLAVRVSCDVRREEGEIFHQVYFPRKQHLSFTEQKHASTDISLSFSEMIRFSEMVTLSGII
jgi:hypothetical protein